MSTAAADESLPLQEGEEYLRGVLERIIYANEENHYTIGEFRPEKERQAVTVVGPLPGVQCGETLQLAGQWVHHKQHGEQFKIRAFRSALPATVYGIRKYLGSGLVPGIGKTYAEKIVDHFGTETLEVIEHNSGRLQEVQGIGKKRAADIKQAWDEQRALRDVMMFLQTYGVGVSHCLRLVRRYGNQARLVIQQDPYVIAREIDGIGFKTADRIALNLGFANDSPERIDAGIIHAVKELEGEGHTAMPPDVLQQKATELLESDAQKVEHRMRALYTSGALKFSEAARALQLPETDRAENQVAQAVARVCRVQSGLPEIKVDIAISWAQERAGFDFAPEQAAAVRTCLENKLTVITGGPGTGKTTILRALVDIVRAKKARILLASPTGRAAQRLAASARMPAHTIHRLLKFDASQGGFTVNDSNPLRCDLLVIDEASMLDTRLAAALFRAIPGASHVVLVGDVNQLPSVGAGNVLGDFIGCGRIPVIELKQIFRQHEQSGIVVTAHAILNGDTRPPFIIEDARDIDRRFDIQFIKAPEAEVALEQISILCNDVLARSRYDLKTDVQILSPMHRGAVGIQNLNTHFRAEGKIEGGLQVGHTLYQVGDKVIQTRNNYDLNIFNGDIGIVTAVHAERTAMEVRFDDATVELSRSDAMDLQPATAISVHKSQGSEYPVVIVPLLKQHFMLLQRNLLYTAITRGKKKVYLIGDPAAYAMAVRNKESTQRITGLKERLTELDVRGEELAR